MKKIISYFIAAILILSCFAVPALAGTDRSKIIFELSGLGIIDENSDLTLPITRGEFAQYVVRLIGMESVCDGYWSNTVFKDVDSSTPYAPAVGFLTQMGILNGVSADSFAPENFITIEQAAKVMVICTGYETVAEGQGGWPEGYIAVAGKTGLLHGVDRTNPMVRSEVYQLLHNALDVEVLIEEITTGDKTLEKDGTTLRTVLMNQTDGTMYRYKGVVNANSYSYVSTPVEDLQEDEVLIDNIIFNVGNTNAADYIGCKVEYYAVETDNGYILLAVRPVATNEVFVINAGDVCGKNGNVLSYYDEEGRMRKKTIPDTAKVLYNGTRVIYSTDNMFLTQRGKISIIDHDGNNSAEVVLIETYESVMASSFKNGHFTLWNSTPYKGIYSFYVDPESKTQKMRVCDSEGNSVAEFQEDRVISICGDKNGTRFTVFVSNKTLRGVYDGQEDDKITVDGVEYLLDSSVTHSLELGKEYTFYLNFNDEIVYSREETNRLYGYVLAVGQQGALGNPVVKILEAGTVDFGVDVNEEDIDDTNQIPYLISQNKAVSVVNVSKKAKVNGGKMNAAEMKDFFSVANNRVVSYKLNAEGEISAFETMTPYGGNSKLRSKYNVYEMVFGGSELFDGFAISSNTSVIAVPTNDADDDDCVVKVKIDIGNNDVGYLVEGYECNEDNNRARLLVIFADMDSKIVRPASYSSSKAAFVTKVKGVLNKETGDMDNVIEILQGEESLSLNPLEEGNRNSDVHSLKKGDLMTFLKNNQDQLENAYKIRSFASLPEYIRYVSQNGYTETMGQLVNLSFNRVDSLNYIMVTEAQVSVNGVDYHFTIPERNKPVVYLYDKSDESITPATIRDALPGMDKLYILEKSGDRAVRAVVIVR